MSDDPTNYTWNVVSLIKAQLRFPLSDFDYQTRAEADALILDRARELGVNVYENHCVTEIQFSKQHKYAKQHHPGLEEFKSLPASATWKNVATGNVGNISFDWVIDASGRNGIMSKALGLRKYNQSLKNIAHWGYWTGVQEYRRPRCQVQLPFFEALQGEYRYSALFLKLKCFL